MRASSSVPAVNGNSVGAISGPRNTQNGSINFAIAQCFRALFPRKTFWNLIALTGVSERVAKHRMSGSRDFTVDEIADLLRSEHGLHFLAALMADARPKWWRNFLAYQSAGDARRALRKHERELQEAINAVETLDAAIARADAALSFQDEDFHRPHLDALRSVTRVQGRALAGRKA